MGVLELSNYIISRERVCGRGVSNLKLQKLLYYVQGFHIVLTGHELFDDGIEARAFGSVVSLVYDHYGEFGVWDIEVEGTDFTIGDDSRRIIDDVCDIFGVYTSSQLENLVCSEDPWLLARGDSGRYDSCRNIIDLGVLADFIRREYIFDR